MENTQVLKDYRVTAVMHKREVSVRVLHVLSGREIEGPSFHINEYTYEKVLYVARRNNSIRWKFVDENGEVTHLMVMVKNGKVTILLLETNGRAVLQEWDAKLTTCTEENV